MSKRFISKIVLALSVALLAINIYGLTQSLRADGLEDEPLNIFKDDLKLSLKQAQKQIIKKEKEKDQAYTLRLNKVIADSIAHVHWENISSDKYNIHIPIWENYILWAMGYIHPEYARYHFRNDKKSLERGIGTCGDTAMMINTLLIKAGIDSKILAFPKHVVASAKVNNNTLILDPDYGVVIPISPNQAKKATNLITNQYIKAGYSKTKAQQIAKILSKPYTTFNNTFHFGPNTMRLETISYFLIWILPIAGIIVPGCVLLKNKK